MTYEELTQLRLKAHEEEFERRERYERLCTGKLTPVEKRAYNNLMNYLGATWDDFNFSLDNLYNNDHRSILERIWLLFSKKWYNE